MYFIFILFFYFAQGLERRLNYSHDLGCDSYNISISYIKAEGPNDTIHYFWDFTRGPSLFLAVTETQVDINLDCKSFADAVGHSFNFTKTPKYEFFLIFNKLLEFNDVNDTGILTTLTPRVSYNTKDFTWKIMKNTTANEAEKFVSFAVNGNEFNGSEGSLSGNFSLELLTFGSRNHDSGLPRLLHSSNSTQCKIILENFYSNSGFNESRFALEFILVSSDSSQSSSKIVIRKNWDDENSPGVFSMVDIITPQAQYQQFRGAFLQWRPVIYVTKVPSIANSSEIVTYNLTSGVNFNESILHSLPFKYYGYKINDYLIEKAVVSLGEEQDGFYKKTNYSSWTFLVSYGSPEEEKFSLLVILVMCIGLGLPALLILVGGTYMGVKRLRRNKDELSLER